MEFGVILGLSYAAKYLLKFAITHLLDMGFRRRDITRVSRLGDDEASNALQTLKGYGLIRFDQRTQRWYLSNTVRTSADIILAKLVDIAL